MTRISLKEQYDNSSVVKQIADLTDQIDGYDETIESAVSTANTAKTTADTAKTTADNAAAKNTEQDSRLSTIEAKDKTQDAEIVVINSKDSEQDIKIETLQQAADTAAKDIDAIESAATDLTNRVDGIESDLTATEAVVATNQSGLATAQGDVVALKGRTSVNEGAIASQATKNTEQDSSIAALQTLTNNITSHLISNVAVRDGTDNGSIMVELTEENGSKITSPNYAWGKPNTFQLVQGTEAGYLRGKLILSDGTEIESNDFQILQIIESDVYVTSITLTPYPTTGKLGGEIGYSNGNTAQINPIDVPTASGVTSNINDLLSRMGVVESGLSDAQSSITALTSRMSSAEAKNTTQDNQITALQSKDSTIDGQITALDSRVTAIEETPGIGQFTNTSRGTILGSAIEGNVSANSDGTGSVSGWSKVATAQTTAALAQSTADDANNKANGCFNEVNVSGNSIIFQKPSGDVKSVEVPGFSPKILVKQVPLQSTARVDKSIYMTTFSFDPSYGRGMVCQTAGVKISGWANLVVPMDSIPFLSYIGIDYSESAFYFTYTYNTVDIDSVFRTDLSALDLPDGTYEVWLGGGMKSKIFAVNYEIADGNLTLTDTASTKTLNADNLNKDMTNGYLFVTSITKTA